MKQAHLCQSVFVVLLFLFQLPVCLANDNIIIGIDADMSSVAAEGGVAIYRGAKIAVDEINAAGGVLSRPLELMVKDHRGNPARGLRNLREFAKTPNLATVLGGVHTPVVLNELKFIHDKRLLFLVPWAAGTPIVENGFDPNYVFRASVRDSEAASVLLGDIKKRGIKRVALILERTGWGRSNQTSMGAVAEKLGLEIAHVAWINWRQSSFADEINLMAASKPQAVVLVSNAPEGAVALRALFQNDATKSLPVVSHWGIAGGAFVKKIGLETLKALDLRVLQTFHFSLPAIDQKKGNRVFSAYQKHFEQQATRRSIAGQVGLAHAYDLVYMWALAAESAGSVKSDVVRQALLKLDKYDGLVKSYRSPFETSQDALWAEDYLLTRYDDNGFLIPSGSDE